MNNKFDELTKQMAQSVTRRAGLKKFGVGLAGMALAGLLPSTVTVQAQSSQLGPLVELSQPNPLAGCNSGFLPPGTMPLNDAAEPFIAVNPVHQNNMVAAWIGADFQNVITPASFDAGLPWHQCLLPGRPGSSTHP